MTASLKSSANAVEETQRAFTDVLCGSGDAQQGRCEDQAGGPHSQRVLTVSQGPACVVVNRVDSLYVLFLLRPGPRAPYTRALAGALYLLNSVPTLTRLLFWRVIRPLPT